MTQVLQRQTPVTAPTRQPLPASILDCATLIDADNLWGNFADGFWTSAGCGANHIIADPLCGDAGYSTPNKTFDSPDWTTGHHFAVYRTLRCQALGLTLGETELVAAFNASEGLSVATAIAAVYTDDAHAVTADDGAVCAFGALVDYGFANYGAAPVFLIPAGMAVALQAGHVLDSQLQPAVGGCLAIGADMTEAFVLGAVVIMRTPLLVQQIMDPATNEVSLLAERLYEVGVDCDFTAKVPSSTNCGSSP